MSSDSSPPPAPSPTTTPAGLPHKEWCATRYASGQGERFACNCAPSASDAPAPPREWEVCRSCGLSVVPVPAGGYRCITAGCQWQRFPAMPAWAHGPAPITPGIPASPAQEATPPREDWMDYNPLIDPPRPAEAQEYEPCAECGSGGRWHQPTCSRYEQNRGYGVRVKVPTAPTPEATAPPGYLYAQQQTSQMTSTYLEPCRSCGVNVHPSQTVCFDCGAVFPLDTASFPKESNEIPSPRPPSDPLGPRSTERHDSVYGLPCANQRQWLHTLYERYESTMRERTEG